MTNPVGDSHQVASGGVIAAGRHRTFTNSAIVGDSITATARNTSGFYWANGANGGKMKLVANCGVSGDRSWQVLARIDNAYTNASPGLAGLSNLGRVFIRIGTNDCLDGTAVASAAANLTSLLNKIAGYTQKVYILAVPPLGATYASANALVPAWNAWYAAFAAANPSQFTYIDDCVNLRDGSGNQLGQYFDPDQVHLGPAGVYQMGLIQSAALASEISVYASPLSKDAADIYPAQPQWNPNPVNAGTGGGKDGGVTGNVANGIYIAHSGSATSVAIVAADVGDANQTPWQRITPVSGTNTSWIRAGITAVGRAMSSVDPFALDTMVEIRLSNIDATKLGEIMLRVVANTGELLSSDASLKMGIVTGINKTVVLRHAIKRAGATTPASALIYLYLNMQGNYSSSIGDIDFRCLTVRG